MDGHFLGELATAVQGVQEKHFAETMPSCVLIDRQSTQVSHWNGMTGQFAAHPFGQRLKSHSAGSNRVVTVDLRLAGPDRDVSPTQIPAIVLRGELLQELVQGRFPATERRTIVGRREAFDPPLLWGPFSHCAV